MKRIKLGELFKIKQGYAFKSKNYVSNGSYALCTLANISESNSFQYKPHKTTYYGKDFPMDFLLQENDLIMPLTEQVVGLLGNTALIPHVENIQFLLNQRVGKIIHDERKTDKYFLHYLLATKLVKRQLEFRASGTKQRNISPDDVYDVTIFLPVIEKQRVIGKILYNIEKKINLNNKINESLEKIAKTLYNYWFVQFDFPDENKRPYKSSGGKMVYNEVLKREIPVEWKIDNFRNHATIASGFSFNSDDYVKDGIWKIVTIKNVQQGYLDRSSIDTIAQIPNKMPDFVKLKPGDILISLTGNIGRMCMVDGDHFLLNQRVGKILSNKDFLLFAYLLLSDDKNQIRLKRISSGSSQQNLSPIQAVDFMFTLPNANILGQFNAQIEPLYNQILILKQQSEILKTLRDFLLPMLMNGQVSVKS